MAEQSSVRVVVRLRPMNEEEKKNSVTPVVSASEEHNTVSVMKGEDMTRSIYSFNNVFTEFSTQKEVFQETLSPMINDVLSGYESTVFAYGQTGTGKTHTMEGDLTDPVKYGVIPRSTDAIFRALKKKTYESFRVSCSYLEIYNEELCDLLAERGKSTTKLEIMNKKSGTFCRGLSEMEVSSSEDVLKLMIHAEQSRKVGETKMNKHSSRSHCIFTVNVQVTLKNKNETVKHLGKLHMVDLAGSECAKTAGAGSRKSVTGNAREVERKNINRSLLTLGRVIKAVKALSDGKKNIRVPYRDSKLTRILQEALGGRSKTLIIATVSPSQNAISESISTLNYAQSANGILNKPVASSYHSAPSNSKSSSSPFMDPTGAVEEWFELECKLKYMEAQIEEAQLALSRKEQQQQRIVDRAEQAEHDLYLMETKYDESQEKVVTLEDYLDRENKKCNALTIQLQNTEEALTKTSKILKHTKMTENKLTAEGNELIQAVKKSVNDGDMLYNLLLEARDSDIERRRATIDFHLSTANVLEDISSKISVMTNGGEEHRSKIKENSVAAHEEDKKSIDQSLEVMNEINDVVQSLAKTIKKLSLEADGTIPTITLLTEEVKGRLGGVKRVSERGDEMLATSLRTSLERLQQQSAQVQDMDENFSNAIESLRSEIDENGNQSKESILDMVSDVMESISAVSDVNTKTRNDLNNILKELHDVSLKSAKDVGRHAVKQHTRMEKAIGLFEEGMKHHNELQNELTEQISYVSEQGSVQLEEISSQAVMLSLQKQAFDDAREKQKRMQAEMMTTVMGSVQQLLSKEMNRLAQENENQFNAFQADREKILELNSSVGGITEDFISQIESRNKSLLEHATELHVNDTNMHEEAKESNVTLMDIKEVVRKQHGYINDTTKQTDEKMTDLERLEEPVVNAMTKLDKKKETIVEHLTESLIRSPDESVQNLARLGSTQTEFVLKEIVPETDAALNDMTAAQNTIHVEIMERLDDLANFTEKGHSEVEGIITKQCDIAEQMRESVQLQCNDFDSTTIAARKADIESRHSMMLEDIENHHVLNSGHLSDSGALVKRVDGSIYSFATNVIHTDKEVPEVNPRKKISFSEVLSSTPADHEIISESSVSVDGKTSVPSGLVSSNMKIKMSRSKSEGRDDNGRDMESMLAQTRPNSRDGVISL